MISRRNILRRLCGALAAVALAPFAKAAGKERPWWKIEIYGRETPHFVNLTARQSHGGGACGHCGRCHQLVEGEDGRDHVCGHKYKTVIFAQGRVGFILMSSTLVSYIDMTKVDFTNRVTWPTEVMLWVDDQGYVAARCSAENVLEVYDEDVYHAIQNTRFGVAILDDSSILKCKFD